MKKIIGILVMSVFLVGCGGGVDGNKTLTQIKESVKTMDAQQIQSKIDAYKSEIEKKTGELEPIMAKLKEIPLNELMGDEAKKIKAEIEAVKANIGDLKEKLDVYVNAYNSLKQ